MKYILSEKRLGDTIHAYCIAKRCNIKLITSTKWSTLFDNNVVDTINNIDTNNTYYLHGPIDDNKVIQPIDDIHIRDVIGYKISKTNNFSSILLEIKPYNFTNKTVILCTRSFMAYKHWNGDWQAIENYLIYKGYTVIYDTANLSIETLVSYIAGSEFIISIDTSCVHIADCYNVPIIGLYTATSIKQFGPYSGHPYCLEKDDITLENIKIQIDKLSIETKNK